MTFHNKYVILQFYFSQFYLYFKFRYNLNRSIYTPTYIFQKVWVRITTTKHKFTIACIYSKSKLMLYKSMIETNLFIICPTLHHQIIKDGIAMYRLLQSITCFEVIYELLKPFLLTLNWWHVMTEINWFSTRSNFFVCLYK